FAIHFLTQTGQMCSDVRQGDVITTLESLVLRILQEFILLSGVLGALTLVDTINHAKPAIATEATVLHILHRGRRASYVTLLPQMSCIRLILSVENGDSIASEGKGDYMFVEGHVLDTKGNPVAGAMINPWESDNNGLYDVQAPGFEKLVTALFFEDDPYLTSDAVFGVRASLIVKPEIVADEKKTLARGFSQRKPHAYSRKDFVLATPEEGDEARKAFRSASSLSR
ncbi:hypothetical protein C0992_000467, partial [Termitomyces sp. T32_za158]